MALFGGLFLFLFPFALLSSACYLTKYRSFSRLLFAVSSCFNALPFISNSTGFPLTRFALPDTDCHLTIQRDMLLYIVSIYSTDNMYILYMYYVSEKMNQKRK